MCGIGAIIGGDPKGIENLMEKVRHRGETFNESARLDDVVLSCNRLPIVDEEHGSQPVFNEDKTVFAVLNGEIYNYQELQTDLIGQGHVFRTNTDTEILVHGHEQWGSHIVDKLDGQFAFVLYDSHSKDFLAARDHFGIKPLYMSRKDSARYFSSEVKQLVGFSDTIEEVMPGHLATKDGMQRYYSLPVADTNAIPETSHLQALIEDAVKKRVQTSLPIAVFFSGGIDSTIVLSTARKYHDDVTAIIMGKEWESEVSDSYHAKRYCEEQGIPYIKCPLPSEQELFDNIPQVVSIIESFEPNLAKQSPLSYYLSKFARRYGFKVALCGEGADELFAGYPEFMSLDNDQIKEKSLQFFSDLYRTQLQRVDRTSMYHTLEVRVPFLDKELVEYALEIPSELKVKDGISKWILRECFRDELPDYILNRKKIVLSEGMGFPGNSLENGLFTELTSKQVSDHQLKYFQRNLSRYAIETKEEAYYLSHYLKAGYGKLTFSSRPTVNAIASGGN